MAKRSDPNADLHRAPCDGGCGKSIWMPKHKDNDRFYCPDCKRRIYEAQAREWEKRNRK